MRPRRRLPAPVAPLAVVETSETDAQRIDAAIKKVDDARDALLLLAMEGKERRRQQNQIDALCRLIERHRVEYNDLMVRVAALQEQAYCPPTAAQKRAKEMRQHASMWRQCFLSLQRAIEGDGYVVTQQYANYFTIKKRGTP